MLKNSPNLSAANAGFSLPTSVVLGVTGGISAYKAAELVRLLVKQKVDVQVVMTEAACHFITPATMQALSGKPVYTSMWDASIANGMPHIELSRRAQAILIAPASADFMAKLVHGAADDLLSTLCLARDCPLIVAPAMNKQMWECPATQRNIAQLQADGILLLGPASGEQACGELGLGRMLEPQEIIDGLLTVNQQQLLAGRHILITAGPTLEAIDPVRGISNFSSGKMGYSIAQAASEMGATVTLISGPTALQPPAGVRFSAVVSAQDMLKEVMQNITGQDIFISVAAVADYRPANPSQHKIKKTGKALTLELVQNEDILASVAAMENPPFCVGFAAESEHMLEYAEAKRLRKNIPLIVANMAIESMGKEDTSLTMLDEHGQYSLGRASKPVQARLLLQHIAHMLE